MLYAREITAWYVGCMARDRACHVVLTSKVKLGLMFTFQVKQFNVVLPVSENVSVDISPLPYFLSNLILKEWKLLPGVCRVNNEDLLKR